MDMSLNIKTDHDADVDVKMSDESSRMSLTARVARGLLLWMKVTNVDDAYH